MSRREEVEQNIKWVMSAGMSGGPTKPGLIEIARTLADEVDAERAIVTKLLEVIKPTDEDDRLREFSNAACDRYGIKQRLYNRALEIAGRKDA